MFKFTSTVTLLVVGALLSTVVVAAPAPEYVTKLSSEEIAQWPPYLNFAGATYCSARELETWSCGKKCDGVPDFQVSMVGGDGNAVQRFFVGYWPSQRSVVVAHEGTDPTQFLAVLTDLKLSLSDPDPSLFPGLPNGVQFHKGFRDVHAKTIVDIFAEVMRLLADTGAKSVTCVGHSLGAAIAHLDSLYMAIHLPVGVEVIAVTFGMPRVGNAAYASFWDTKVHNYRRINNKKDPVPIVPWQFMGYRHSHGEIHHISEGQAFACSGDDNAIDKECQVQSVPNVAAGNPLDHLGPYEGIWLGTIFCN